MEPSIRDFEVFAQDRPGDTLPLYKIEGDILSLWDRLHEVKLERALLEHEADQGTSMHGGLKQDSEQAERECLQARAEYLLRQSVIEDTLIASPILNAVHSGNNATGTERTLKPLLIRRDALEMALTNMATTCTSTVEQTRELRVERALLVPRNRELAAQVASLAAEIDTKKDEAMHESDVQSQLDTARAEADTARRQWKVMQGVVAAVVAGSGINWAKDETLRSMVLDTNEIES